MNQQRQGESEPYVTNNKQNGNLQAINLLGRNLTDSRHKGPTDESEGSEYIRLGQISKYNKKMG